MAGNPYIELLFATATGWMVDPSSYIGKLVEQRNGGNKELKKNRYKESTQKWHHILCVYIYYTACGKKTTKGKIKIKI